MPLSRVAALESNQDLFLTFGGPLHLCHCSGEQMGSLSQSRTSIFFATIFSVSISHQSAWNLKETYDKAQTHPRVAPLEISSVSLDDLGVGHFVSPTSLRKRAMFGISKNPSAREDDTQDVHWRSRQMCFLSPCGCALCRRF